MRVRWIVAIALPAVTLGTFEACVGDTAAPSTPDASASDSSVPDSSFDTGADVGKDGGASDASDGGGLCSDPAVGLSFNTSTGAANAVFFPPQVGPLLAGDYKLVGLNFYQNLCFPAPCPYGPKSGNAIGGLRVTAQGGSSFLVERRIEFQQSQLPRQVLVDRFSTTYDQLNRTLAVTRQCTGPDAGATDAGTSWKIGVEVIDGGATGKVILEVPDLTVVQVYADGGVGPNTTAVNAVFQKQ